MRLWGVGVYSSGGFSFNKALLACRSSSAKLSLRVKALHARPRKQVGLCTSQLLILLQGPYPKAFSAFSGQVSTQNSCASTATDRVSNIPCTTLHTASRPPWLPVIDCEDRSRLIDKFLTEHLHFLWPMSTCGFAFSCGWKKCFTSSLPLIMASHRRFKAVAPQQLAATSARGK